MSDLEATYRTRHESVLEPLAKRLEVYLQDHFKSFRRIDRIGARAKSVDRFLGKAGKQVNGSPKYTEPLSQIQDHIPSLAPTLPRGYHLTRFVHAPRLVELG